MMNRDAVKVALAVTEPAAQESAPESATGATSGGVPPPVFPEASILVVDDQEQNLRVLSLLLKRAGYARVTSTADPREAVALFDTQPLDLVLLDLRMPHLDGFEVMEALRRRLAPDDYLPVLVLTTDASREAKNRALALGAKDFVSKPFDVTEVTLRVRNLLQTRWLHLQLRGENARLERRVRERTAALEAAYADTVERLARAAEYRDDATGEHAQRVGGLAADLARELGWGEAERELLRQAALLHDVGKIGIPDRVLLKPGPLESDEFSLMQQHSEIGAGILEHSRSPVLELAEVVARSHHERWDGSGYAAGASGETIPLAGRIVAVADAFDALTHKRPYKPAWSVAVALTEIVGQSGKQFDPQVVDALQRVLGAARYESGEPAGTAATGTTTAMPGTAG